MPYHSVPYFEPYLLFHVNGRERRVHTSVSNEDEANFAVQLVQRFRLEYPRLAVASKVRRSPSEA